MSATAKQPGAGAAAIALWPATPEDDRFLRDLYAEGRAAELAPTGWSDEEKRAFCDSQYALQDRFYREHFDGAQCLVVSEGGAPIGRVYRATVGRTLYLLDIALVAAARGRGIGTLLLEDIVAMADRERLAVRLHVEPDNPAQRLYRRLGFEAGAFDGVYVEMTRPAARLRD